QLAALLDRLEKAAELPLVEHVGEALVGQRDGRDLLDHRPSSVSPGRPAVSVRDALAAAPVASTAVTVTRWGAVNRTTTRRPSACWPWRSRQCHPSTRRLPPC